MEFIPMIGAIYVSMFTSTHCISCRELWTPIGTLMGTIPHRRLLILAGSPQLLLTSREWQWWHLMVTSVPLPHLLTLYTTGGGSSAAGWVRSARRHCSLHLGYALWSRHGWCWVPSCDRYAGCLSIGQACDHARTYTVPVSWVGVRLDHLHALCLQGWVRLPGGGKFRLAVRRAHADFPPFSHTHARGVGA